MGGTPFVGRRDQLRLIDSIWRRVVDDGCPRVVIVEAQPGMGKTALIREFVGRAGSAVTVDRASPLAVEHDASWSTLRMLVHHYPSSELPAVVLAAVGRAAAEVAPPSNADVAFGWAEFVRRRSTASIIVLDDVQWCDAASAAAIATAMRSAPCLWVIGMRAGATPAVDATRLFEPGQITELELTPLGPRDVASLVRAAYPQSWTLGQLNSIIELGEGHPLFVLELARDLAGQPRSTRPATSLSAIYGGRIADLPPDAADLTALVALAIRPSVETLAAVRPDVDIEAALALAEQCGLLQCEGLSLTFTHALARHAVIESLGGLTRARLHRDLADHLDDLDGKAFHLGRATVRPDAVVAAALEQAGRSNLRRGANSDAADLFERAAQLTPEADETDRQRRVALAGVAYADSGDYERGEAMLSAAMEFDLDDDLYVEVSTTAIVSADRVAGKAAAERRVAAALDRLPSGPGRAKHWRTLIRLHQFNDLRQAEHTARQALDDARRTGDDYDVLAAESALANVRYLRGEPVAIAPLVERLERYEVGPGGQSAIGFLFEIAIWDDQFDLGRRLTGVVEESMRSNGNIVNLFNTLSQQAFLELRAGNLSKSEKLLDEVCDFLRPAPGADLFLVAEELISIAATRGDVDDVDQLIASTEAEIDLIPPVMRVPFHAYSGYAQLTLGRIDQAMRHLLQAEQIADRIGMTDVRGLGFQADLAEVAILTGELAVAARVVEQLAAASERTGSLMAEVDHLRCRGMLQLANGDTDAAVATLGSAVERARDRVRPMLVARTLLAHGVALRRQGARAHAREHLMEARRAFSQLDSPPWIRRVDDQLERLGARPPVARGSTTLTPTERQIAELVASGRSNREIAAALHISLRTVESNLTRVYRKLAVRGRTELAAGGSDLLDA